MLVVFSRFLVRFSSFLVVFSRFLVGFYQFLVDFSSTAYSGVAPGMRVHGKLPNQRPEMDARPAMLRCPGGLYEKTSKDANNYHVKKPQLFVRKIYNGDSFVMYLLKNELIL